MKSTRFTRHKALIQEVPLCLRRASLISASLKRYLEADSIQDPDLESVLAANFFNLRILHGHLKAILADVAQAVEWTNKACIATPKGGPRGR
jgi:hypothetical protein